MSNVTRTSVSVPIALRARMNAAKGPVNWSAVACRAFERELSKLEDKGFEGKPDWRTFQVYLIGDTPLICHRWDGGQQGCWREH